MNDIDSLQQGFSQVMTEMSLMELDAFATWFNKTYPVIRDMTVTRRKLRGEQVW